MSSLTLQPSPRPLPTGARRPAYLTVLEDEGPPGRRAATAVSWLEAVERSIISMRERLAEPITLQSMAEVAILSPYHFNRVFCRVTGVPPGKFLTALRVDAAKRLLLSTGFSVTRVCAEVGYQSLGTFTTHFAQLVGMPPCRLRRLARTIELPSLDELGRPGPRAVETELTDPAVVGSVVGGVASLPGPIFVGLFAGPAAQGRPVVCDLMAGPGQFRFTRVPDGRYYPFVVTLPWSSDPQACLLPDRGRLRVAAGGPVDVRSGVVSTAMDLRLRPVRLTDPPILVALPLVYVERCGDSATGRPAYGRPAFGTCTIEPTGVEV